MSWVVTCNVDPDKATPSGIGSAAAVFTDTDGTTFTYSYRGSYDPDSAAAFASAAIAARNTWQSEKAIEVTAMNTVVDAFTTAGETATAGKPT